MMRKGVKVLAVLLAMILAVANLPLAAFAEEPVPQLRDSEGPSMRFVQTGFDSANGILTMSVQIKPSVAGSKTYPNDVVTFDGRFVFDGYLLFQVDTMTLEPVAPDPETGEDVPMVAPEGQLAFVGSTTATANTPAFSHLTLTDRGLSYGNNFNNLVHADALFHSGNSAYITSLDSDKGIMNCYVHFQSATGIGIAGKTNADGSEAYEGKAEVTADGYVNVVDLRFRCYAGSANGVQTIANSTDLLFRNSIRLPQDETEAEEMLEEFYTKSDITPGGSATEGRDENDENLAMGGAGFREVEVNTTTGVNTKTAYHYYGAPRSTSWLQRKSDREWSDVNTLNGTPGLTYDNQDKRYVLTKFEAGVTNSIAYDKTGNGNFEVVDIYGGEVVAGTTAAQADFQVPSDEGKTTWYPRYDVPTEEQMSAVRTNAETVGAWAAASHGKTDKYVKLSYYLNTTVSASSQMKPETDAELGGINGFLKSINWQFYLYQGAGKTEVPLDNLLDDLKRYPETEKTITTVNGQTYSVQEAEINTAGNSYNGYRVWIARETTPVPAETAVLNAAAAGRTATSSDTEEIAPLVEDTIDRSEHVVPMGVLFDFNNNTTISYYNDEDQYVTINGYAPQLMITNDAANPESYLWAKTDKNNSENDKYNANAVGRVCFQPIYMDSAGGQNAGGYFQVKLYKEDPIPTYTTIELDDTLDMTQPEDGSDPIPTIDATDAGLSGNGIALEAYVYDQYGFKAKKDGENMVPDLPVVSPDAATTTAMNAAGKSNAFTVETIRADSANKNLFRLRYASERTVNDAVRGTYEITAGCAGAESARASLQITKVDDYFAFMASYAYPESNYWSKSDDKDFSPNIGKDYEDQKTFYLMIPKKNNNSETDTGWPQASATTTVGIRVTELANQWRDPDQRWQDTRKPEYRVVSNLPLTEADGVECVDLRSLIKDHQFKVSFAYGLDPTLENKGRLTGVDLSTISRGIITYNSDTPDGSELYVRLTVTPPDRLKDPNAEGDGSIVHNYHFVFMQDTKRDVMLLRATHNNNGQTDDGETGTLSLSLPEENSTTVGQIKVDAYHQYGSVWLWPTVMNDATYGRLDPWSLKLVPGSIKIDGVKQNNDNILTGVTIAAEGRTSNVGLITVAPKLTSNETLNRNMKVCEFQVRASFGLATQSNIITVRITRAAPYPKRLEQFREADGTYSYAYCDQPTVDVPTVDEPDQVNETQVKLKVINQYGEEMSFGQEDKPDEYIVEWAVITSETPNPDPTKLLLDKSTGKLQVKSCAPEWKSIHLKFTVWGIDPETGKKDERHVLSKAPGTNNDYRYDKLVVQRSQPGASDLGILTDKIELTDKASFGKRIPLEAAAKTMYGDNETPDTSAAWTLLEVGYRDETFAPPVKMYTDYDLDTMTFGSLTGKIKEDTGNSSYVDTQNMSVRLYSKTGEVQISYKNDERLAASYIVVGLTYGGQIRGLRIPIEWADSYPDTIEIRTDLERDKLLGATVKVPDEGQISTKQLTGTVNVRDQYEFMIRQANRQSVPCVWSIEGETPQGVTLKHNEETGVYSLEVDHTAQNGSVTVKATYTDSEGRTATLLKDVGIGREPGEPTQIAIRRIQGQDDFDLELPGLTEDAKIFYLDAQVKDNYGVVLSDQAVSWSVSSENDQGAPVDGDPYGLIKIESAVTQGKLTLAATDAWHTGCNGDTEVWIKATIPGTSYYAVQKIDIHMAEEYSAYAQDLKLSKVPGETDFSTRPGREEFVAIPAKNSEHPNKATLVVDVYSQYKNLMPNADVLITLDGELTGITLGETVGHKATMEIRSNADFSRLVHVNAIPINLPEGKTAKGCTGTVGLDRGAAVETEITFGTGKEVGVDDNYQGGTLVRWNLPEAEALAFRPTEDETYREFDLYAFVADQYGADYSNATTDPTNWYPYWKFDTGCEGVTFGEGMTPDENGVVQGQHITIKMSNKTMGKEEFQRTVTMKVWMAGYEPPTDPNVAPDPDFCKTLTIQMTKSPRQATYLYFRDIDETDGTGKAIERPVRGETTKSHIAVEVYDQYGYIMEGEGATLSLLDGAITTQDPTAELKVLYAAEDPETPETDAAEPAAQADGDPVSYVVMRNGVKLAQFDPATGIIELQSAFDLSYLGFGAQRDDVRYTNLKMMKVPVIEQAEQVAASRIQFTETGEPAEKMEFVFTRSSDEIMAEHLLTSIDNQYGVDYSAGDVTAQWTLLTQGDDGSWVPYEDLDVTGVPKPAKDWAVRLVTGDNLDVWVVVQPEQYTTPLQLQLQCTLLKGGVPVGDVKTVELSVRRKNTISNGGLCTVVYQPGLHGKLLGDEFVENVPSGQKPNHVPKVEPEPGWTLRGWRMDSGELVPDPTQMIIGGDTVFTAEYIQLEEYQFLSGYDDGTVRPATNVTRGEFTRMLVDSILGYDPAIDAKYANPFWDVGETRYYRDYIAYAYFYGVAVGYTDGTFHPDEPISRAESTTMLARAINVAPSAEGGRFADVNDAKWYSGFINALSKAGIVNGYTDNTFRPENYLTRAESVALLVRVGDDPPGSSELELIRKNGESPFVDLFKDYWAYPYILRAAGVA